MGVSQAEIDEENRRKEQERMDEWMAEKASVYKEIDVLLDKCLLTAEQQESMMEWADFRERLSNYGTIPTERYNNVMFIEGVGDILKKIEKRRYLNH